MVFGRSLMFMILFLAVVPGACQAQWERVSAGIPVSEKINFIEQDALSGTLYAGTEKGLYASTAPGEKWRKIDVASGGISARRIAFPEGGICLATGEGLYLSGDGQSWMRLAGKKGFSGVEKFGEGKILAWTEEDLYIFDGNGFRRAGPMSLSGGIDDVAFRDDIVYLGSGGAIYYSADGCRSWNKYHAVKAAGDEAEEEAAEDAPEEQIPIIRKIDVSGEAGAVVATGRGIFLADPGAGILRKIDTAGLPASEVGFAVDAGGRVIAATGRTVFVREKEGGAWLPVFESAASGGIKWLKVARGDNGENSLLVSSEHGIFAEMSGVFPEHDEVFRFKRPGRCFNEPGIREVQEMAVEYAEVSPKKIKSWRRGAAWKALLPKLSVGFSESRDDNVEIYKNSSLSYIVEGPREIDNDWGVDLSWDLSDLIWNDAQTSIDVRSKLMVQLREDILEEVTRLYFERKRLLTEISGTKDLKDKAMIQKQLRLQELTAYIDALTGGGFSRAMRAE